MKIAQASNKNYFKLEDVDDEDLGDFINDIKNSYGINFNDDDFKHVNTYGELCDVIMSKLDDSMDVTDCTGQQAFYKLRNALACTLDISKSVVKIDTKLEALIPRGGRLTAVKTLNHIIGVKMQFLEPPTWYVIVTLLTFILSLIAFSFSWKVAVSGILLSIAIGKIGDWFGKEFKEETVGDFARQMTRKHYRDSRRKSNAVNKAEMKMLLDEQMVELFDLDRGTLTRDAKFRWVK